MQKKRKDPAEDLQRNLEAEYARWHHLKDHGGSDPFWPDGMRMVPQLEPSQRKQYDGIFGYVKGLEMAISGNMLVDMRRHEHPERYQERFHACRLEVERQLQDQGLPMGHLSIFDLFSF